MQGGEHCACKCVCASGRARSAPLGRDAGEWEGITRGACVWMWMCVCSDAVPSYTYHSFLEIKDPSFCETMFSAMSSCSGSYWKPSVLSS